MTEFLRLLAGTDQPTLWRIALDACYGVVATLCAVLAHDLWRMRRQTERIDRARLDLAINVSKQLQSGLMRPGAVGHVEPSAWHGRARHGELRQGEVRHSS
jgi:hypothetical protein